MTTVGRRRPEMTTPITQVSLNFIKRTRFRLQGCSDGRQSISAARRLHRPRWNDVTLSIRFFSKVLVKLCVYLMSSLFICYSSHSISVGISVLRSNFEALHVVDADIKPAAIYKNPRRHVFALNRIIFNHLDFLRNHFWHFPESYQLDLIFATVSEMMSVRLRLKFFVYLRKGDRKTWSIHHTRKLYLALQGKWFLENGCIFTLRWADCSLTKRFDRS